MTEPNMTETDFSLQRISTAGRPVQISTAATTTAAVEIIQNNLVHTDAPVITIITDPQALARKLAIRLKRQLNQSNHASINISEFNGECSYEEVDFQLKQLASGNSDNRNLIIGIGGGKTMDCCKLTAAAAGQSLVLIPSQAATCASFSPHAVIHYPDGMYRETSPPQLAVDLLVLLRPLLENQPPRLLAAGLLDSAAKIFESRPLILANQPLSSRHQSALELIDSIQKFCQKAADFNWKQQLSADQSWEISWNNIITTGMVGYLAGSQVTAYLAHHFAYQLLKFSPFSPALARLNHERVTLHGEDVAISLLLQEKLLGNQENLSKLSEFYQRLNFNINQITALFPRNEINAAKQLEEDFKRICDNFKLPSEGACLHKIIEEIIG